MKLDSDNSVFNMGDTSIRVKQVVDVNKVVLAHLLPFTQVYPWETNTTNQEQFYQSFLSEIIRLETELNMNLFTDFKRKKDYIPPSSKIGLRGRTLTNALLKSGFIYKDRTLSDMGKAYLNDTLVADKLEKFLNLKTDNLAYFRQYLKLKIFDSTGTHSYYNFRFAIKFLAQYPYVPKSEFLTILLSIKPTFDENLLNQIIVDYQQVRSQRLSFKDYYTQYFSNTFILQNNLQKINQLSAMFNNIGDFPTIEFSQLFFNGKGNFEPYIVFVADLIRFIRYPVTANLDNLLISAKKDPVKTAFGFGKTLFIHKKGDTVANFLLNNKNNPLLTDNLTVIYEIFLASKYDDLIREYGDMCQRYFEVTGIISFNNDLVSLNDSWFFDILIEVLGEKFNLSADTNYHAYEEDKHSIWFKNTSLIDTLMINPLDIERIIEKIGEKFGDISPEQLQQHINNQRELEFRQFIHQRFPKQTVIDILRLITMRDDDNIQKKVTDTANVPTIFEYILTLAWYYIAGGESNIQFHVHKSFNLTLDGNKLPLTHASGGQGDIEIITDDYALLIEGTLMDANTQKRGELEPVIRHSINFTLTQSPRPTQTLFIANVLDTNVLNIFRAMQFVDLVGTSRQTGNVQGLNIYGLTTHDLIKILQSNKTDKQVLAIINSNKDGSPQSIRHGWRNKSIKQLLN